MPYKNQVTTTSADLSEGANITATPAPNARIVLDNLVISTDADMDVMITDENETILSLHMAARRPIQIRGEYHANAPDAVRARTDRPGNISISALYYEETVE